MNTSPDHPPRGCTLAIALLLASFSTVSIPADAEPPCFDYATTIHWQEQRNPAPFGGFGPVASDVNIVVIGKTSVLTPMLDVLDTNTGQTNSVVLPGSDWPVVAIQGNLAYAIASAPGTFHVVDVTNGLPVMVGELSLPSVIIGDIAPAGTVVFVSTGSQVVEVIDVADPSSPSIFSTISTPGPVGSVAVNGDLLFVGGGSGVGLHVYDVSNLGAPVLVGSLANAGIIIDVAVSGDLAFICGPVTGPLTIVDVADPTSPSVLSSVPGATGQQLAVDGDRVWSAGDEGLRVVDVSNPLAPEVELTIPFTFALGVAIAGDVAHISAEGALQFFALGDQQVPEVGKVIASGVAPFVANEQLAVIDDGPLSLGIVDLTDPASPAVVAHAGVGAVYDLAWVGDYVFVTTLTAEVQVVDISNPMTPTVVASVATPGAARDIDADGDLAIVNMRFDGVAILDISDPTAPVVAASLAQGEYLLDVAIEGATGCYSRDLASTVILDLSIPTVPLPVAGVSCCGPGLHLENQILYHNFSDPDNSLSRSLQIYDLSTPAEPVALATLRQPYSSGALAVDAGLVYKAGSPAGVLVYDFNNPPHPELMGGAIVGENVADVAISGDYVVVGTREGSLIVLPKQCRETVALVDAGSPEIPGLRLSIQNPMRVDAPIFAMLDQTALARLAIFDAEGRLVRNLVDGKLDAGVHRLLWDGRNNRSVRVACGVYFVRLATPTASQTTRVVVLD
jgi:hypothetical protein